MTASKSNSRVRFYSSVQVVEIMSLDDYRPGEIEASWFSDQEMEQITKRCYKVIRSMDSGRSKKYCIRGLEGHSKLGSITKKRNRTTSIAAVLMEQSNQWVDNTIDEQAIADAYRRTTSSCQMWACVVANQDRQAADAALCDVQEELAERTRIPTAAPQILNKQSKEFFPEMHKFTAMPVNRIIILSSAAYGETWRRPLASTVYMQ